MIESVRVEGDEWLFFVFLAGASVMALLKYMYPQLFLRDVFYLSRISETGDASSRRISKGEITYSVLVSCMFACMAAVVFFLWYRVNAVNDTARENDFAIICAVAVVYVILKYFIDKTLMWLFDLSEIESGVMEKTISFRLFMTVWGGGLFFVAWYVNGGLSMVLGGVEMWILVGLYVILYLINTAEYLLKRLDYFLYFILYLCMVEICPAVLGWIWIKNVLTT